MEVIQPTQMKLIQLTAMVRLLMELAAIQQIVLIKIQRVTLLRETLLEIQTVQILQETVRVTIQPTVPIALAAMKQGQIIQIIQTAQ
jgi:hypothetical protein